MKRRSILAIPLAASIARVAGPARADAYPPGPIRVIVPFPPAGGADVVARLVTQAITADRGWQFVVDNRPGAGGNIGMEQLAKARADGATFGVGQTANLAINPSLYPKLGFDPLHDFAPVALLASQPLVLVVAAGAPYRSLAELVDAARARPDSVTMASPGNGTVGHLGGELFARRAGVRFVHVPYKGAAPALTDVIGGQVVMNLATPQSALPQVRAGKLRALAVTSSRRLPVLPDVPTIAESGFPGFVAEDWKAMVAPRGTPADAISAMNAACNAVLAAAATRDRLAAEGSQALGGTPAQLAALMKAEHERWGVAVRESGARVE